MQNAHLPCETITALLFARDRSGTLFLYEALDQGNAGTIQAYGALREAVQLREESVARLLAAQRKDGTPRLYSALAHGHADAVKAYRNLFPDLPVERLIRLLVAKRNDGKPEPFTALHERHAEVIRAYGPLLQTLPMQASSSELLAAVNEHGIQGLHIAVQTRCWKAVEQYTRSRDTLSDDGGRKLV